MTSTSRPQTAFVTGASAGFGAAIARRLASEGWRVVIAARRLDRLDELADELGRPACYPLRLDVTDVAAIDAQLASLPASHAQIDCLINNAGLALGIGPAQSASLDHWDTMLATNCRGLVHITRHILPAMVARRHGHIVNLGSVAGSYPYPGGNVYGATKAFVRQFSLNLRSDLHGTGVKVSCIEPGLCGDTEFSRVRFEGDADKAASVYHGMTPIAPADIAATVGWILAQPAHFNVNSVEVMPVAQSLAGFQVARTEPEPR